MIDYEREFEVPQYAAEKTALARWRCILISSTCLSICSASSGKRRIKYKHRVTEPQSFLCIFKYL